MQVTRNKSGAVRNVLVWAGRAVTLLSMITTLFIFPPTHAQNPIVQTKRFKPELVVQTGHSDEISAVAFSPDGKMIASGSWDNTIKLWDVETGNELRTFQGGDLKVLSIAFSPDGKKIAAGCGDFRIRMWNVQTGELKTTPVGEMRQVNSIIFSPDGKTLISGSEDAAVRIWDVETGNMLRQITTGPNEGRNDGRGGWSPNAVKAIAYSPERNIIASAGPIDRTINIWDAVSGAKLKTMTAPASIPASIRFISNGNQLISAGGEDLILWDTENGNAIRTFQTVSPLTMKKLDIAAIDISPDGRTIAGANQDGTLEIWSVESGKLIKEFPKAGKDQGQAVAFSPDGKTIAMGAHEGPSYVEFRTTVRLFDADSGSEIRTLEGNANVIMTMALSSDGQRLLESHDDSSITMWNPENFDGSKKFKSGDSWAPLVFAPSAPIFLIEGQTETQIWNSDTTSLIATLSVTLPMVGQPAAFEPDGKRVAIAAFDNLSIWDVPQGKILKTLVPDAEGGNIPNVVAIDPSGTLLAGGNTGGALRFWDLRSGKETTNYTSPTLNDEMVRPCSHTDAIDSIAFSANGKFLASAASQGEVKVCDANGTKELWSTKTGEYSVGDQSLVFSPDSQILAGITHGSSVHLWDAKTGKLLKSFPGDATSKLRHESLAFSKDGKRLFTTSGSVRTKVWDVAAGTEIASLITIGDSDWAVITPGGYFDASDGAKALMHFVVNDPSGGYETFSLDQINSRRWMPGLLKQILDGKWAPPSSEFAVTLFPGVQIEQAKPDDPSLKVDLQNRGGGIGRVEVRVNGSEYTPDARNGAAIDKNAPNASLQVDISKEKFRPGDNKIDVIAWNLEGDVQSRSHSFYLNLGDSGLISRGGGFVENKTGKPPSQIDYYAVVSGISNYGSDTLNLRYAAKDAEDMARALTVAARKYFCADEMAAKKTCTRVHVRLLSTETDEQKEFKGLEDVPDFQRLDPVKANYEKVFAEAAKTAKADDVVTVYFSGHATSITTDEAVRESSIADTYLYATREATTLDRAVLANETERRSKTVSSLELAKWLSDIKAGKKVLILDTCAAGAVQKDLIAQTRDVDPLQAKSIERLRTRTGFYVLMGSAANAQSYEANEYRQGLLTYSLLEGMTIDGKLRDGRFLDVEKWFGGARDRVEDLAKGIGGVQEPSYFRPCSDRGSACSDTKQADSAGSFDIGRIDDDERKMIPLASRVPLILEPFLFEKTDADDVVDTEGLTEKFETALYEQSIVYARGSAAPINYINAKKAANGISPNGFYTVSGDQVTIEVSLARDKKLLTKVKVTGTRGDVINKLVQEILRVLPSTG